MKCIYTEANKDIYGNLDASLLFWGKRSKSLKVMGYKRNEYDWCIMNKITDDNKCIILCHVDDMKPSRVYPV